MQLWNPDPWKDLEPFRRFCRQCGSAQVLTACSHTVTPAAPRLRHVIFLPVRGVSALLDEPDRRWKMRDHMREGLSSWIIRRQIKLKSCLRLQSSNESSLHSCWAVMQPEPFSCFTGWRTRVHMQLVRKLQSAHRYGNSSPEHESQRLLQESAAGFDCLHACWWRGVSWERFHSTSSHKANVFKATFCLSLEGLIFSLKPSTVSVRRNLSGNANRLQASSWGDQSRRRRRELRKLLMRS